MQFWSMRLLTHPNVEAYVNSLLLSTICFVVVVSLYCLLLNVRIQFRINNSHVTVRSVKEDRGGGCTKGDLRVQ